MVDAIGQKGNRLAKKTAAIPAKVYQHEEFIFKFLKYLQQRDLGKTRMAAAREGIKWLFDYNDLSLFEKNVIRRYVRPFYTFPRKALPRVVEAMAVRPHTVAKYPFLAWTQMKYSMAQLNITEKDYQRMKKILPRYLDNGSYILMPWRDANGDLQFFDWTYIIPWGEIYDARQRGLMGSMVTNPLIQMYGDIQRNKNAFTGAKIYDDRIPPDEQTPAYRREQRAKMAKYFWQGILPPLSPKGMYWERIEEALQGKDIVERVGEEGKPRRLPQTLLHTTMGLKFQPIDLQVEHLRRLQEKQAQANEIAGNMAKATKEFNEGKITEEKLEEKMKVYEEQLQKVIDAIEEIPDPDSFNFSPDTGFTDSLGRPLERRK
jgi:hypothetical protein